MKIISVIPVYNEEESISRVVNETRKYCDEVIVVDDYSNDQTYEILNHLNITFIRNNRNRGQGYSTKAGIEIALQHGADIVVTLDGDGQHDPSQIPKLIAPFLEGSVDVVIGSRFMGTKGVPLYRQLGIRAITRVLNLGHKRGISDSLMCFRAYGCHALRSLVLEEEGFGFCMEMMVKILHRRFVVKEIPARCIYHKQYSRNSTLGPLKLAAILIWKTIKWRIRIGY
jgi:glycosyltransferase involved in cell wall biosynthesis